MDPAEIAEFNLNNAVNLTSSAANLADNEYNRIAISVLETGQLRGNRTDKRAISAFGNFMRFNIEDNLALITTKKLPLRYIVAELLWFISGSSEIGLLNEISKVPKGKKGIWDDWALTKDYHQTVVRDVTQMVSEIALKEGRRDTVINQELAAYQQQHGMDGITKYMEEHGVEVRAKVRVGIKGYVGPLYGHQWRRRQTEAYIDQLEYLLNNLNNDPLDRRHLLVAWDPDSLPRAGYTMDENILMNKQPIAPCHWGSQYYVNPVLTDSNTPLLSFETDELGAAIVHVNPEYLSDNFRFKLDGEWTHDINTEEYSVKYVTEDDKEVEKVPAVAIENGISIERDRLVLKGLQPNAKYELHSAAGLVARGQKGKVSGMLHMRSSDVFLGLPFNIASYALLVHLMARELGHTAKDLFVSLGDYHIYENHVDQIKEQLLRPTHKQAKFALSDDVPSIRQIMQMNNSPISLSAAVDSIVACIEGYTSGDKLIGERAV